MTEMIIGKNRAPKKSRLLSEVAARIPNDENENKEKEETKPKEEKNSMEDMRKYLLSPLKETSQYTVGKRVAEDLRTNTLNFIFIGKAGYGKSSFINTVIRALFPENSVEETWKAPTRELGGHGTQTFDLYPICAENQNEPIMTFMDTKGIVTFSIDEMENVQIQLKGLAKDGMVIEKYQKHKNFWQTLFSRKENSFDYHERISKEGTLTSSPHCIVLVVAVNEDVPIEYEKIINLAQLQELPIIWLITKIDQCKDPLYRKKLEAQYIQADKHIAGSIFEIENYKHPKEPTRTDIDYQALVILRQMYSRASQYVLNFYKKELDKKTKSPKNAKCELQ